MALEDGGFAPVVQALMLLGAANATPIALKRLLGARWAAPLDGGRLFVDGRPVLGPSKTLRGVLGAVAATALAAWALGLDWRIGAALGALSMAGDLLSSFLKRRLGVPASGRATGLDQVGEALLPLVVLMGPLGLTLGGVAVATLVFFLGALALSRLLYSLGLREEPY